MSSQAHTQRIVMLCSQYQKGIVGVSYFVAELMTIEAPAIAEAVIAAVPRAILKEILEFLYWYPVTELGWHSLSLESPIVPPTASLEERGDIERIPTQAHRTKVEQLRMQIRAHLMQAEFPCS
jgi:hypothetical protein